MYGKDFSALTASNRIFLIFSSLALLDAISIILLEISKATTFLTFGLMFIECRPRPQPISKTMSFAERYFKYHGVFLIKCFGWIGYFDLPIIFVSLIESADKYCSF